jgi:hypothetical protein
MKPVILDNLFSIKDYSRVSNIVNSEFGTMNFDDSLNRFTAHSSSLDLIGHDLTQTAQKIFCSRDIKLTYCLYAKYVGPKSSMFYHYDDNACTYTIDYCFRQSRPWPISVDGSYYTLFSNQALCFLGNESWHGRDKSDLSSDDESVEMLFFHFAKSDHWYFENNNDKKNFKKSVFAEELEQRIKNRS